MAAEYRVTKRRSTSDDDWGPDSNFDTPKKPKQQEEHDVNQVTFHQVQGQFQLNGVSTQNENQQDSQKYCSEHVHHYRDADQEKAQLEDEEEEWNSSLNHASKSKNVQGNFREEAPFLSNIPSVQRDALFIASVVEDTDVNEVYKKLMEHRMHPQRVDVVTNKLLENMKSVTHSLKSQNEDSMPDDPAFRNDPIFSDMHIIRKILPDKDPNEIYAFLEAHRNQSNRILIVIQQLTKTNDIDNSDGYNHNVSNLGQSSNSQSELDQLKDILPECDPNYLYEKLEQYEKYTDRMQKITTELFTNPVYPRLKETLERENKQARRRRYENLHFNMREFLQKFPDPSKTFYDERKSISLNYKEHCLVYLKTTFRHLKHDYFKQILKHHNYHLTPTVREIEICLPGTEDKMKKTPHKNRSNYPDEADELFFHELLFINNEKKITDHLEEERHIHEVKVAEARAQNELYECPCCFNDDCLFEEMCVCPDGHLFCNGCVRKLAETAIGEGKSKFPCLTGICKHDFQLSLLQKILSPNMFSIALRKMQEEELREAGIPNLETCPFCSFAAVMSNKNDKVFKCLNPECLKQSCRLCKEPNHIPLRCNEVEKGVETKMRAYIELKMTEAMFRKCPECDKRFFKEDGCNAVTCPCGFTICYVCGKNFDKHNHKRCSDVGLNSHQDEMKMAAEEAKNQYLKEHPDMRDTVLKYDPLKHIEEMKKRYGRVAEAKPGHGTDFYDDSESSSDSFIYSHHTDSNKWDEYEYI